MMPRWYADPSAVAAFRDALRPGATVATVAGALGTTREAVLQRMFRLRRTLAEAPPGPDRAALAALVRDYEAAVAPPPAAPKPAKPKRLARIEAGAKRTPALSGPETIRTAPDGVHAPPEPAERPGAALALVPGGVSPPAPTRKRKPKRKPRQPRRRTVRRAPAPRPDAWTADELATLRCAADENWRPVVDNPARYPDGRRRWPLWLVAAAERLPRRTVSACKTYADRHGIRRCARTLAPRPADWPAADVAKLRRMLRDPRATWETMAVALDRRPEAVRGACHRLHGHRRLSDLRRAG